MKAKLAASFLFFFSATVFGQHQDVFPGLSGAPLLDSLVAKYKSVPLGQATARDTLFAVIYNVNDSLTCVYSGSRIYLDPTQDPTEAAFASPAEINTEHTYPKSFGSEGIGEGDLHHIYPTRSDVNNARGNLPFAEIPDAQTGTWYYLAQQTGNIPTTNIGLYSEGTDDAFEVPETHKGNVARAMLYFYTMYRPACDAADPNYFDGQREALCAWHLLDPVDQAEWSRTWGIAQYQQGKPNPYVLDCTLAERTFCGEFGQTCSPVATSEVPDDQFFTIEKIQPNPMQHGANFQYSLAQPGEVRLGVYDLQGKKMAEAELGHQAAGRHRFFFEKKAEMRPGIFIVRMAFTSAGHFCFASQKMVVLP